MITQAKLDLSHQATQVLQNLALKDKQTDHIMNFLNEKEKEPNLSESDKEKIANLKLDMVKLYEMVEAHRQKIKKLFADHDNATAFSVGEAMQEFLPYL